MWKVKYVGKAVKAAGRKGVKVILKQRKCVGGGVKSHVKK